MAPHPTPSFAALQHALLRRSDDYHYSLPSITPPVPTFSFFYLKRRIRWIEDALQRSPPLFSLEIHNNFTEALVQIQVEALDLQRDIEMNPSRVKRGAANAKDEGFLDGRRTECYEKWKAGLDVMWKGIMEKSERELKEEDLQEVNPFVVVKKEKVVKEEKVVEKDEEVEKEEEVGREEEVEEDIKPNNVMVSYKTLNDGIREIESVALIDTEDAAKLKETQAIFNQVGNVLWRSPEAQAGVCVQNSTDIWSFGATALYGITKRVVFAYDDLEEGVLPEIAVVCNQLSYFGPLTKGLFDLMATRDSVWGPVFLELNNSFDSENPAKPFALWKGFDEFLPGDKEFFLRMMKLTPANRPTAEKLLEDPWFSLPYA
ncbi:MAG: hypothetical protein Q9172_001706 [Xanthocarpia lactea]